MLLLLFCLEINYALDQKFFHYESRMDLNLQYKGGGGTVCQLVPKPTPNSVTLTLGGSSSSFLLSLFLLTSYVQSIAPCTADHAYGFCQGSRHACDPINRKSCTEIEKITMLTTGEFPSSSQLVFLLHCA